MNQKHIPPKKRYRCLILLLATSLSIAVPRVVNAQLSSKHSQTTGLPTYLGQSPSTDWGKLIKEYYFTPALIGTIMLVFFGIPNVPKLISQIHERNVRNFRKDLSNSFKDLDLTKEPSEAYLDCLTELRHQFKTRLIDILMEKEKLGDDQILKDRLFEDCLKECLLDFKNVPSPEDSHLLIVFRKSIQNAVECKVQNQFLDEIFDTLNRDSQYKNKLLDHLDKYFKRYVLFPGFSQDEVISELQKEVDLLREEIRFLKNKIDQIEGNN